MPPRKWLIQKRMKVAYDEIRNKRRKIAEVCADVGFKNLSHFSTAFKKQYGFVPAMSQVFCLAIRIYGIYPLKNTSVFK